MPNTITFTSNPVKFDDDNEGYEQIAQALIELGFNWEHTKTNKCCGYVCLPNSAPQLAFDLPAGDVMDNGEPLVEFGALAGVYEGIKQTIAGLTGQCSSLSLKGLGVKKNHIIMVVK